MKSSARSLLESHEPGFVLVKRGKVRDVYRCGYPDQCLLVATDRLSAFDHVLPTPIPGKGIVLTQMSNEWFRLLQPIVPNHLIAPAPLNEEWEFEHLHNRCVLVKRAEPLPVEASACEAPRRRMSCLRWTICALTPACRRGWMTARCGCTDGFSTSPPGR